MPPLPRPLERDPLEGLPPAARRRLAPSAFVDPHLVAPLPSTPTASLVPARKRDRSSRTRKKVHANSLANLQQGGAASGALSVARAAQLTVPVAQAFALAHGVAEGDQDVVAHYGDGSEPGPENESPPPQRVTPTDLLRTVVDARVPGEDWEEWREGVNREEGVLLRFSAAKLWIVKGFNPQTSSFTGEYHHFGVELGRPCCNCPVAAADPASTCTHTRAWARASPLFDTAYRLDPHLREPPPIFTFLIGVGNIAAAFSAVQTPGALDSGRRVVVVIWWDGSWHCYHKSCRGRCDHIKRIQPFATERHLIGPNNELLVQREGELTAGANATSTSPEDLEELEERAAIQSARVHTAVPISVAPRPPAIWLRVGAHEQTFARMSSKPLHELSPRLSLDAHARCNIGHRWSDITEQDQHKRIWSIFTVYHVNGSRDVKIETVRCPHCPQRQIGPDLVEVGLFNVNNKMGYAREVFDDLIARFTTSETPYSAYCEAMRRSYLALGSERPFPEKGAFIAAWYGFARTHQIDSGMTCPKCEHRMPNLVIADGCCISHERKYTTGHNHNPTTPDIGSHELSDVRAVSLLPLSDRSLRMSPAEVRTLRQQLLGYVQNSRSLPVIMLDEASKKSDLGRAINATVAVIESLSAGPQRSILVELVKHLASRTPIFAILHPLDFGLCDKFIRTNIIDKELARHSIFWHDYAKVERIPIVRGLFKYLLDYARSLLAVLEEQTQRKMPLSDRHASRLQAENHKDSPITSGSMYGSQQIRSRPLYPGIRDDAGSKRLLGVPLKEDESGQDECTKLYDMYAKHGLTGGMMGFWCEHGVCIGAHAMDRSEGRDDVFAPLLTRWERAPAIVIYDFACQLAAYCWLRAPTFFKHTRFYIDKLHSRNHSDCSRAMFWGPAVKANPNLHHINTSYAESSHSTLRRLKKTVSYQNEEHANLHLWTTMQVHNRMKILRFV